MSCSGNCKCCYFGATKGDLPDPLSSGLCDCAIGIVQFGSAPPEVYILGPDSRINPLSNPLQRTWLPLATNSFHTLLLFGGQLAFNGAGPFTFFLSDDSSLVNPGGDVTKRNFPILPPGASYPVGFFHRLSVNVIANTLVNDAIVDVVQGGLALTSPVDVTIPAGTTPTLDAIGDVAFSSGTSDALRGMDIRVRVTGTESTKALVLAVVVELSIPTA